MSNRNTITGGTDFSDNTALPAADLNDTFDRGADFSKIGILYTGTGFDTTQSGTGTNIDGHELGTIAATALPGNNYLRISILGYHQILANNVVAGTSFAIHTKEVGGAYSASFATAVVINPLW